MARAQATDYLQVFRYHALLVGADGTRRLSPESTPDAGFSAITSPRLSIEPASYKEGTMMYARKQPGAPAFDDIEMSRGITRQDTSFWSWAQQTGEGSGEYRADIQVYVYHRAQALVRTAGDTRTTLRINTDNPAVILHIREAFPNGVPLFGDLEATSSEIAVQQLGITYESAYREDVPVR